MSLHKRRILVVDDDSDVGLSLKLILEVYGLEVDSFVDPVEALNSFSQN